MSASRVRVRPRLRLRARVALALVLGAGLLLGAWLWVRDSPLVAVRRVEVLGAAGPDGAAIRSALVVAARSMTTLDVSMPALRTAVAAYPVVKHLQVQTQFPHGMRIRVVEQVPVAVLVDGQHRLLVAGDGTLLRDGQAGELLPAIDVPVPPGGTRVSGQTLVDVDLAAAAPYQLLGRVQSIGEDPRHGLLARLRGGPAIYFGDSSDLAAKWNAAAEVLADPGSAGASYIDVTVPARPAAGIGSDLSGGASGASAGGAGPSAASSGSTAQTGSTAPSGGTAASGSTAPAGGTAASGQTAPSGGTAASGSTAPSGGTSASTAASGSTAPSSTSPGG